MNILPKPKNPLSAAQQLGVVLSPLAIGAVLHWADGKTAFGLAPLGAAIFYAVFAGLIFYALTRIGK